MSKAYAMANAKKKKETVQQKQSPSVSKKTKQVNDRMTQKYGGTTTKKSTPKTVSKAKSQAVQSRLQNKYGGTTETKTEAPKRLTLQERQNQKSYGDRNAQPVKRQTTSSAQRRTNANNNLNLKQNRIKQSQAEAKERREFKPTASQQMDIKDRLNNKYGVNKADEKRVESANRVIRNTGSAAKKGVQDALSGYGKTISDVTEMTAEKGTNAYAMKLGIDNKQAAADRKRTAEDARKERLRFAEEQDKRQKKFDNQTKGAKGLEKALYGAVESGTGMAVDIVAGLGTQAGALASMGVRTYGQTRGQAEKEGATEREDRLYSVLQAGKEVGTELMFPGVGLARKAYGSAAKASLGELAANTLLKNLKGKTADVASAGIKLLGGTVEENLEEIAGWGIDPILKEYAYGRNARKRDAENVMRERSDALRSQITNEDDAKAAAAYISSPSFIADTKREYINSGMNEKDAEEIASRMRDYLTASLTGDTKAMSDIEDEVGRKVAGLKKLSIADWDFKELAETVASTTLLTATTGMPGTISTATKGAAIRDALGSEGTRALAKTAIDFEDEKLSRQGRAIQERLDSGKDITSTQAYELMSGMHEQVRKDTQRVEASRSTAARQMESERLVVPFAEDPRTGEIIRGEVTEQTFRKEATSAKKAIEDQKASLTEKEVDTGSRAIANFKTGTFGVDDANALNYSNTAVREAFKAETGINLDSYIVRNRDGSVDIPATNTATKDALFALAADNLVRSAQAETVNWMDNVKGEVVTQITSRMGAKGSVALQQALDDVDERDRSRYMMTANATDMLYQAARNMGESWEEVKADAVKMFPNISEDKLQMMYEAGLEDRNIANDKARGRQVRMGESMSQIGEQETATGMVYVDTPNTPKGTMVRTFTEIAQNLGADIHLTDAIRDKDGNVIDRANGSYDPKTNSFYLNVDTGIEKNVGYIFMHELTHYLRRYAPEQYQELENLVREKWFGYDASQMQDAIARKIEAYKIATNGKQILTEDMALEEIICDAAHEFINDPNFAKSVAEEDPALAQAVLNSIRNALRMLRRIFASGTIEDETHMNSLFSELGILSEAEEIWLNAYKQAVKNRAMENLDAWEDEAFKDTRQSLSTTEQDAEYMDAVNRGDMETAQRMVDEAAERAGYDIRAYHGTNYNFTVFDPERSGKNYGGYSKYGQGLYFADSEEVAKRWGKSKRAVNAFLHLENPFDPNTTITSGPLLDEYNKLRRKDKALVKMFKERGIPFDREEENGTALIQTLNELSKDRSYSTKLLQSLGYDGIKAEHKVHSEGSRTFWSGSTEYVVFEPSQAKSADPITYDDSGNVIPLSERFNEQNEDIRYSVSPEAVEALNESGVDITESGTAVRYSYDSWMNTDIDALKDKLRQAGYDDARIDAWVKDVNSISALILGDMKRLNYAADQFQDALKPNAEYFYTLDLSTLCQKRRLYQGTYNKIMHYLVNRVLMPEDTVRLRAMMDEMGYQVPCGICYEESRKKNEGKFAERWLNGYGKKWKGYKNQEHKDPYIPTLDEVTTTDGREKLRAEHPEAYESYVQYQKTRGSANPKISYTHTDYRGDILRMTDSDIQKVKHIGGLRIQSFSDFEIPHVIDMMQAVMDMSAQKLTAQAYTKVPAFAEIFGGTGIKINLSLIGRWNEETQQLEFDAKEGIDPEHAFKLRDKYSKNVGTILVGSDDKSILKAWADPRVDMVIPFHRSGWSKKEFEKLGLVGYKDYTKGQTERYMMGKKDMALSTASKALGLTKDEKLQPIYSADYWDKNLSGKENAERYLALCAEKHYRPVFYQFLHDNGDGTWSLQEDGSTDGYWKSLIDFKMYDNEGNFAPQELVQPTFDMEQAQKFMAEYEGGADTLPVADDVVTEFLKEYKENHPNAKINIDDDVRLSISVEMDEAYMDAVNSGNMEEAQRLVDEAAKRAGYDTPRLHHGSPSFGFTTFDLSKGEGIIFATNNRRTAETYSGETDRDRISEVAEINVDELYGEKLLDAAKKYTGRYSEYRLMTGSEKEDILEEDREEAFATAKDVENFISENKDSFDGEKLDLANRIVDAINRIGMAWNDDDAQSAFEDYWNADYDLMWMDESIQKEIIQVIGPSHVEILKKRIGDMLYAGDLYARGDSKYQYVFDNQLALELDAALHRGIYGLYGRSDNQLVIDANGANWNQIVPPAELELDGPQRTRSIAEAAKKKGYDSVLFKDLRDNGGATPYNGESDVYMFFNPSQVKSADTVTYAEDGSVIPLSERFDPSNDDIRYSLPTQDADGNILSDVQMDYFKNSQARDSQGRLVPVYHTTNMGGFTVFDPSYSDDHRSLFFSNSFDVSQSYANNAGRPVEYHEPEEIANAEEFPFIYNDVINPGYYQVYLNLENPLVIDGKGQEWNAISLDTNESHNTREWAEIAYNQGYDGVIFKNIVDIGSEEYYGSDLESDIYIAFSSNQVKDIRNLNPTENPDIRYSVTPEDEAKSKMAYADAMDDSYEALERYEKMAAENPNVEQYFGKAFKEEDVSEFYSALRNENGIVFDDPVLEEGRQRVAKTKNELYSNIYAKANDRWTTGGEVLDIDSVKNNVRNLVMGTMANSNTDHQYKQELVDKTLIDMRTAFQLMKQDRTDIASALLYHSAQRMIENVDFIKDDTLFQEYKGIRDYLRREPIYMDEEYWQSKTFLEFQRANMGKLKLRKGNGNVDVIYGQLEESWPHIFNETERHRKGLEDSPENLLEHIEYVINQNQKPFMEAYSSEEATSLCYEIADNLYTIMAAGEELNTLADTYKKRFDERTKALKARHQEAIARVRENAEKKLDREKSKNEDLKRQLKTQKLKTDAETRYLKYRNKVDIGMLKAENAKERRAERERRKKEKAQRKENALHKKYMESIQKSHKALTDRLRTNTKDKHIPEFYKKQLAALLGAFDFQTMKSKQMEMKEGPDGYVRADPSAKTIKMLELQAILKAIENQSQLFHVSDSITDIMDNLLGIAPGSYGTRQSIDGKTLDELDSSELKDIDRMLKSLIHEFNNYENVRVGMQKQKASTIGGAQIESCLKHAEKFGTGNDYLNFIGAVDQIINLDEMTPAYLFRRIDPTGNGLGIMWKELRRSFDRYVRNQNQLNDWMEEIVGKYHKKGMLWNKYGAGELSDWRSENYAKEFTLSNGQTIKLTIAQMMSIHCLAKRDQAYRHMTGAGIVVKPVTFQAKMMSDLKKKANYALPVSLSHEDLLMIDQNLTKDQIDVADKLQQLMATKMAEWGNEASMNVIGIRLFEDPDYFPIKSDKAALEKDFSAEQFTEMIRSFGFTKAVQPGAKNAIAIDDIFDVVTEHCNNMNLYNSYTESLNDFMKVYNYHQLGPNNSDYSVEQAVAHAYSQKATTFISTFIKDLNGNVSKGRQSGISKLMDASLGNAKKASVFANGRVALQQPTALVRAFAVISPKYLAGVKPTKENMKEMFEHCPIALWKSWGYYDINMGKSIEDLMMNNGRWLEDMASDLYGKLDNATWSVIWGMCKNEIKATHKDVKEGTDEFFDLVNERMSEVVDLTQVVDSPFHRSHAMRSKDFLHKMTTAFMAEPTLTFNMLRDGFVRAREAWKEGNKAEAGKILGRTTSVFVIQVASVEAAAAIWDAIRGKKPNGGDDDDKNKLQLWYANFIANLKDNALKPWNNIYYIKDIASIMEGWDQKNLGLQGFEHLADAYAQLTGTRNVFSKNTWYQNALYGIGYLTGVPFKTLMNDSKSIMNIFGVHPGFLEYADDKLMSLQDMLGGESSSAGINKPTAKSKKSSIKESSADVKPRLWDYENAPIKFRDGSLADSFLNAMGINLTEAERSEIAAKAEAEERDQKIEDIISKTESLSGEEKDKKVWSYVTTYLKSENEDKPLSDFIQEGDYDTVEEYKEMYLKAGGNAEYFDSRIFDTSKRLMKKSIINDPTDEQIEAQNQIKDYLLSNGMTEDELSEMAYKSDIAKDLKVAFRLNDKEAMLTELEPLVRAGLTYEDLERLWENRNRMNLKSYKGKYKDRLKSTGTFVWPTQGTITSHFGYRNSPTAGASSNHPAIDIGAATGTPVVAADGGVVITAGNNGGYGNSVGIKHDNGMVTYYNHLYSWNVKVGDTVAQGQQIAQVGSTGISTGPHLDFKIMDTNGKPVDPEKYLPTN